MLRVLFLAISVALVVSYIPIESAQPSTFGDAAFSRYYARGSAQVQQLRWGSGPLVSLVEPYAGAPGNRRLVQYFERGRMELASGSDRTDDRVTEGALVWEMATGSVQTGIDTFVQEAPAEIPILSGAGSGLTYADFSQSTGRATDRTGPANRRLEDWLTNDGSMTTDDPPETVYAATYNTETGHNIPDVFVSWFARTPFGSASAADVLGDPISEPYWVRSGLGELGISLIQLFEKRVVIYTPGELGASGTPQVEDIATSTEFNLASSGRHYYQWRHGGSPPPGSLFAAADTTEEQMPPSGDSGLSLPEGYTATALEMETAGVTDIAATPDGRLAVARSDGTVLLIDPTRPDAEPTPLVEHLANPEALAYAGTSLYVVDDTGLHRYDDIDGDGISDTAIEMAPGRLAESEVTLATGPDGSLYVSGEPAGSASHSSSSSSDWRLLRVAPDGVSDELPNGDDGVAGPFIVDDAGGIWFVDDQQLTLLDPGDGREDVRLDTGQLDGQPSVIDLLLYRPDGTNGDPAHDILALVVDDAGNTGRIVRLQPFEPTTASGSPTATKPGAIVDFIGGFDRPTAMATGLDGSLYVLDAGHGAIYRIQPE